MLNKNKKQTHETVSMNDVFRLIKYAFQFKTEVFKGLSLLLIAVLIGLLSPFIIKHIFDYHLIQNPVDQQAIIRLAISYLIIEIIGQGIRLWSNIEFQKVSVGVIKNMRIQVFEKIQEQHIEFFDTMPAGKIVSKITNDTAAVGELYTSFFSKILSAIVYLAGVIIALWIISPPFAMMCTIIVLIGFWFIKFYTRHATRHTQNIRQKLSELNGIINESIQGIPIIRAYNGQNKILNEFEQVNKERADSEMKLLVLESALSHNIISILRSTSMTLLILYFGIRVLGNRSDSTIGNIYVYMNYIGLIFKQANGIFEKMPQLQRAVVASKQVFEIIDKEGTPITEQKIERIKGNVSFRDIWFAYKEEEYVLKNINFEAKEGQTIGLVGHTGSGKSSILNLLMKFYQAQKGQILIDGQNLADIPAQSIREHMGIVLQEPYLFTGTILSNITLDNPSITRKQAEEALAMVGGDLVLQGLKEGIDEKVVERGNTLSAGQRQLISFARALAHDPRILILDEATSSVDSQTEQIIQEGMKILMQGRTTFVIAHRLSTIKNADKILLLDKGKIVEQGNHEELIAKKGRYYEMYQAQSAAKFEQAK